jgi:DNA-binding transcriptional regulator YiaG
MAPRKFDEQTLQDVYKSFTEKARNESPLETYQRVAQEFGVSAYDVEAHINEMHKGSRMRLPFVISPESAGMTPKEASAIPKPKPKLSDEQIYAARMTGVISLEEMAKILGTTRSEVRQAEQRHMRTLRNTPQIQATEPRGMPSRRRPGSTMPSRARRLDSSVARVQTIPNAKPDKTKKSTFGAGSKKVGPNDGKFIESLAPGDKDKATKAMQELELEITNALKGGKKKPTKRNPNPSDSEFGTSYFAAWWRGQMRGAEKQTRRGGTFAPRNYDDKLTTSDITEMRLVLDAEIAAGRIDTIALDKDGKPKVDKDGNPLLSPAEKAQRMLDDMQTLIEMRDSNSYEMVEHLHTESQKKVAEAVTGKTKMRGSEIKKLGLGEESSFWGRARGLDTGLSALTEEDKKLADTRQRFLRVNPERKRKRELKAARKSATRNRRGRQLTETSPELAIEQKKLRFMAAKRELAARLRRNRSADKLEQKVKDNKSDNHKMVTRNADGTFTINPRFASALAFVSREYSKDSGLGRGAQRRQAISNLWENTGFSNEPVLISKDEVQGLIDAGWTPIIRGTGNEKVKGEAYVEQFLTNPDRFVPGQGGEVHGFGEYFTDKPESWNGYRGGKDDRHTILALIPPSATVVDKQTLKNEQQAMHKISETMLSTIQELGGKETASQLTSGEIAAALRKGLTEKHDNQRGRASHAIVDSIISRLEEMDKSGKDSVKEKSDAIEALSFLHKAAGTDEEGRFAPIIGVSLERSHSNVILLHDRSAIAAVHVPLEDELAQKLAKGQSKATKVSKAQKKAKGIVDVSGWTKTGGQRGSNAAGTFKDPSGVEHYVKQPSSQIQAENEVLAARLYNLAGVKTPEINLGDENGSPRVVSKIMTDIAPASSSQNDAVADTFVAHAWLGNWDALLNNNTQVNSAGEAVTIDAGGAILFRANAGRKGTGGSTPFGDVAGEMDTLRDASVNPTAARVFGRLTPDQIKTQVTRLRQITPDQIRKTVDTMISDMGERKKIADTLVARQQDIINRFG